MKTALFFILLTLCSFLSPRLTLAQEFIKSENVTVKKNETINQDLFAVGKNIVISGEVNGDAYLAGENILIEGKINGDLISFGKNITILGQVTQNARTFGKKIKMYGTLGRNLSFVGETATISTPAKIDGSITSLSKEAFVDSPIGKGATLAGEKIIINSEINGNVLAAANEDFLLGSDAKINGNLNYYTNLDLKMIQAESASISGEITHNIYVSDREMHFDPSPILSEMYLFFKILGLLSIFIFGALITLIIPRYAKNVTKQIDYHFLKSTFFGLLALILMPVVIILLFIILIGIPFAILLIPIYLAFLFFGSVFSIVFIGEKLMFYLGRKKNSLFVKFTAGFIAFAILSFVPIFGQFICIVATLTGTGAFILEKKRLLGLFRENENL